jgi:hypothetical protein
MSATHPRLSVSSCYVRFGEAGGFLDDRHGRETDFRGARTQRPLLAQPDVVVLAL